MKAPEHTYQTPQNGAQHVNYSMLPPDRLPSWLLEKNKPEPVYNFSMRPPGNQPPVAPNFREMPPVSPSVPMERTMAAPVLEPDVFEPLKPIVEIAPETTVEPPQVSSAPAESQYSDLKPFVHLANTYNPVEDSTAIPDNVLPVTDNREMDIEAISAPVENVPATETSQVYETPSTLSANYEKVPAPPEAPAVSYVPPSAPIEPPRQPIPAMPQQYPSNNNSNLTMILVIGVIVFVVVLVILLALGVV